MQSVRPGFRLTGAILIGCLALLVVACGSDEGPGTTGEITPELPQSYYLEALISVSSSSQTPDSSPFPPDGPALSELKLWMAPDGNFRQETVTTSPAHFVRENLVVSNGETSISYDSSMKRFYVSEALT